MLTRSDTTALAEPKDYHKKYFVTNNMGRPKYFLGIEIIYHKCRLLSQKKNTQVRLKEISLNRCKSVNTPI